MTLTPYLNSRVFVSTLFKVAGNQLYGFFALSFYEV